MAAYSMRRAVPHLTYEGALVRLPELLKGEGFGVLTEIDVKETLKKKINVDFKRYKIVGACNPPFAHQALLAEEELGLFLPCNLIVFEGSDGKTVVSAIDPEKTMGMIGNPKLAPIAAEVKKRLARVLEAL